jgi:hypothetical protein
MTQPGETSNDATAAAARPIAGVCAHHLKSRTSLCYSALCWTHPTMGANAIPAVNRGGSTLGDFDDACD